MHFESEKQIIREKFSNAGFPIRFTDSVITQFEDKQNDDGLIIPEFLFKEPKKFVLIEIPFCESNESLSKRFLEKLRNYTSDKIEFAIKWSTKKVKQLFPVKDKNPHPACKIYQCAPVDKIILAKPKGMLKLDGPSMRTPKRTLNQRNT